MEKFGNWRDRTTGIHPFLPVQGKARPASSWPVLALGAAVALFIKLPLLISSVVLLMTMHVFILSWLPSRAVWQTVNAVLLRVVLFLLGFSVFDEKTVTLKRFSKKVFGHAPVKPGDVLVMNHCSYIDLLYISCRYSPVFAAQTTYWALGGDDSGPKPAGRRPAQFALCSSLWTALRFAVSQRPIATAGELSNVVGGWPKGSDGLLSLQEAADAAQSRGAPLVVFPEAVMTNGRALIQFSEFHESLKSQSNHFIQLVGIKYDSTYCSPSFVVGSPVYHLWCLLVQWRNRVQIRYLDRSEAPDNSADLQSDKLEEMVAALIRSRRTTMTAAHRADFIEFWNNQTKKHLKKRYDAKWAVVTGSSSGIGKALVKKLAGQGINVVLVALDDDVLTATMKELQAEFPKRTFRECRCNLAAGDGSFMKAVLEATSDLDVQLLFNNAGFMKTGFFADSDLSLLMAQLDCNARSMVPLTHHFVKRMVSKKMRGAVFFTSSPAYLMPQPFAVMYGSTKAFVTEFGSSLAPELREHGIDVLVMHPSPVSSNFYQGSHDIDSINFFKRRAASPEDIAGQYFSSVGRCVVRDQGWFSLVVKLALKVFDFSLLANVMRFALQHLPDYQLVSKKKK